MIVSPLNYHGGKTKLARRILELAPPHTHYTEAFFGGGSVLFTKNPENVSESVNDLDGELTNFWRVVANPSLFGDFFRVCRLLPLSQVEFDDAKADARYYHAKREIDQAVRFWVRHRMSRQGLGKSYRTPTKRLRRGMNEQVSGYLSAVDGLAEAANRLMRVEIRCMDFEEYLREYDHATAWHYLDPPYLPETRIVKSAYKQEMRYEDHVRLLECLTGLKGRFTISGYDSELYQDFANHHKWQRHEIKTSKSSSSKNKKPKALEILWIK